MIDRDQFPPSAEPIDIEFSEHLRTHARFLHAHLQVWSRDRALIFSEPPAPAPALVHRAATLARRAAHEDQTLREEFYDGRTILALPVRCGGSVLGLITASAADKPPSPISPSRPVSAATSGLFPDPKGAAAPWTETLPGEVQTTTAAPPREDGVFDPDVAQPLLESLAAALGSHMALRRYSTDQADELSCLYGELGLRRRISEQLADPGLAWQTMEFILREGCIIVGAELAMLQLSGARAPMVIQNPTLSVRPIEVSPRAQRHMAGQLWWRLGSCSARHLQGSLQEILGGPTPLAEPAQVFVSSALQDRPKEGFIAFLRSGSTAFRRYELRLLDTLAEQGSQALRSADLHENVSGFLMSTVKALVSAIETKDRYTSGHSARVNLISMLLGKELKLTPADMESLKWASILHDVGKIGLPETILNKPGQLSAEEFEIVKQHPWRGYEVLSHIGQLKTASQAVLFHHERPDGRGYPMGLSGTAIPKLARVIAVADTYDALTTTRPYREAQTVDEAHEIIKHVSGNQLDPEIVNGLGCMIPFLREHKVIFDAGGKVA